MHPICCHAILENKSMRYICPAHHEDPRSPSHVIFFRIHSTTLSSLEMILFREARSVLPSCTTPSHFVLTSPTVPAIVPKPIDPVCTAYEGPSGVVAKVCVTSIHVAPVEVPTVKRLPTYVTVAICVAASELATTPPPAATCRSSIPISCSSDNSEADICEGRTRRSAKRKRAEGMR